MRILESGTDRPCILESGKEPNSKGRSDDFIFQTQATISNSTIMQEDHESLNALKALMHSKLKVFAEFYKTKVEDIIFYAAIYVPLAQATDRPDDYVFDYRPCLGVHTVYMKVENPGFVKAIRECLADRDVKTLAEALSVVFEKIEIKKFHKMMLDGLFYVVHPDGSLIHDKSMIRKMVGASAIEIKDDTQFPPPQAGSSSGSSSGSGSGSGSGSSSDSGSGSDGSGSDGSDSGSVSGSVSGSGSGSSSSESSSDSGSESELEELIVGCQWNN